MKIPKIIYNDKFLNFFSWFMKIGGITLYPFIVLREKYRDNSYYKENYAHRIINHESIHIKQQQELILTALILLIGLNFIFGIVSWWLIPIIAYLSFYMWYILEWFIKLFIYGKRAYRKISFEQEAYDNQENIDYLKTRKRFSWLKLIFK